MHVNNLVHWRWAFSRDTQLIPTTETLIGLLHCALFSWPSALISDCYLLFFLMIILINFFWFLTFINQPTRDAYKFIKNYFWNLFQGMAGIHKIAYQQYTQHLSNFHLYFKSINDFLLTSTEFFFTFASTISKFLVSDNLSCLFLPKSASTLL